MTSPLLFLQDRLKVKQIDGDQIQVTVTLPSDLLLHFVRLLDSLAGFFQIVNRKSRLSQAQNAEAQERFNRQAQANLERYHSRLIELHDLYLAQGLDRKTIIKRIAADLRAANDPWCDPDLVRMSLIEAGRPGRPGRSRRSL